MPSAASPGPLAGIWRCILRLLVDLELPWLLWLHSFSKQIKPDTILPKMRIHVVSDGELSRGECPLIYQTMCVHSVPTGEPG